MALDIDGTCFPSDFHFILKSLKKTVDVVYLTSRTLESCFRDIAAGLLVEPHHLFADLGNCHATRDKYTGEFVVRTFREIPWRQVIEELDGYPMQLQKNLILERRTSYLVPKDLDDGVRGDVEARLATLDLNCVWSAGYLDILPTRVDKLGALYRLPSLELYESITVAGNSSTDSHLFIESDAHITRLVVGNDKELADMTRNKHFDFEYIRSTDELLSVVRL